MDLCRIQKSLSKDNTREDNCAAEGARCYIIFSKKGESYNDDDDIVSDGAETFTVSFFCSKASARSISRPALALMSCGGAPG